MALSDIRPSGETSRTSLLEFEEVQDRKSRRKMREIVGYTVLAMYVVIFVLALIGTIFGGITLPVTVLLWVLSTLGGIGGLIFIFARWLFPHTRL